MPTWGKPLRKGIKLMKVIQHPTQAVRFATREVLNVIGLTALTPIIGMILPIVINSVQAAWKAYIDAEIKRRMDEERQKLVTEVYRSMSDEDRALFRSVVAE
jgi:hypothetical protein